MTPLSTGTILVRQRRFELPCPYERYHLKVVRLPISPSPQKDCKLRQKKYTIQKLSFNISFCKPIYTRIIIIKNCDLKMNTGGV